MNRSQHPVDLFLTPKKNKHMNVVSIGDLVRGMKSCEVDFNSLDLKQMLGLLESKPPLKKLKIRKKPKICLEIK